MPGSPHLFLFRLLLQWPLKLYICLARNIKYVKNRLVLSQVEMDFINVALHNKKLSLASTCKCYQFWIRPKSFSFFSWSLKPNGTSQAYMHGYYACAFKTPGQRQKLVFGHAYICTCTHTYMHACIRICIVVLVFIHEEMETILTTSEWLWIPISEMTTMQSL